MNPVNELDWGARYRSVRALSVAIAELFPLEDRLLQAMPQASPIKWHLAHTTWFFETFLLRGNAGYAPLDERYVSLFNSYYNSVGPQPDRAERGLWSRPTYAEVAEYREHVDEAISSVIERLDAPALERLELGLHHEQQHQELMLTDTLAGLYKNPLQPCAVPLHASHAAPKAAPGPLRFRAFTGGLVEVGHRGHGFHFDNESPSHQSVLLPFELASRPLCNADVIEFVEAGGYQRPELWLSDGFDWVRSSGILLPCYWSNTSGEYRHFSLHGSLPVAPEQTACHLSYFEADAMARYFDARLPTEMEWEYAAGHVDKANLRHAQWLTLERWLPLPARDEYLSQMFGTVWEWTSSAYCAYPGFRPSAGAIGEYNGKFMHGQYVLRGGSLASPQGHIRTSYRNFFPAHARWQFSGVRLARDVR